MPVTIKDIAKAANVSRGTVDRALNDRGGVNADVAARIKSIAADMGYKPNTIAKALATRSNPVRLGVILNSIGNPFWDKVIDGINSAYDNLSDFGISMEIRKMRGYDQDRQLHELEHLKEKGIDGLVITPISTPKVRDALNELIRSGVQVVCCNLDIDDVAYQAYVGCDYMAKVISALSPAPTGFISMRCGSRAVHRFLKTIRIFILRIMPKQKTMKRSPTMKLKRCC